MKGQNAQRTLRFTIGLFNSWSQSIECNGSEIRYESNYSYGPSKTLTFNPTDEDWNKFWKKLRRLGVWNWKNKYYNMCFDGTSWSLDIEHEERKISCEGSNSYPGVKGTNYGKTFTAFCNAISDLVGSDLAIGNPPCYPPRVTPKPEDRIFNSFVPTYRYRVKDGKIINGKILNEKLWEASGVVYARTHKNSKAVVYIGKTDGPLKTRIKDHLRRIPRYTKPKDIDYREWAEGKAVTIYAYQPKKISCLGLTISTQAGLEHALIEAIDPMFVSRK